MINSQWNPKSLVPSHYSIPFQRRLILITLLVLTSASLINCTKYNRNLKDANRQISNPTHRHHQLSTSEPDLLSSNLPGQQPKHSDQIAPGPLKYTPPLDHIGRMRDQLEMSSNGREDSSELDKSLLRITRAFVVGDTNEQMLDEANGYNNNLSPKRFEPLKTHSIDTDFISGQFVVPPESDQQHQEQFMQQDSSLNGIYSPSDGAANLLDLIEPGSGIGFENIAFDRADEQSNSIQAAGTHFNEFSPTPTNLGPLMTPIFDQMPPPIGMVPDQLYDQAPVLVRRLPRLVGTAGSSWRFKVPSATFQDEDGDLRYLRSALIEKQFVGLIDFDNATTQEHNFNNQQSSYTLKRHLEWLQYDQSTQTLYGFPTENDIGLNVFLLVVSDRWGFSSNETIQIAIRPHQSSRAVTHAIKIDSLEISSGHHPRRVSISDLLTNLVKSISEGVFAERSGKNMIIQSYTLTNSTWSNATLLDETAPTNSQWATATSSELRPTLSVTWFNSSLPIHPCDPTGVESIFRALIDQRQLAPDWSMLNQMEAANNYQPSQALIKSLQPELRPTSVQIQLMGACENKRFSVDSSNGSGSGQLAPRVRTRLGKLRWKLGQPIAYKIPEEIFIADDGRRTTRNLSLTLHTIDGKTLDQELAYNYLEFDQETQTIFGLPYDLSRHVGSRELLLTARHPATGQRVRETFIMDIEAQDLTTINNRAFRVSLYFMTRVNVFGPREQVLLSHRIVSALDVNDQQVAPASALSNSMAAAAAAVAAAQDLVNLNAARQDNDDQYLQFTIIQMQKFTAGSFIDNSATLSDPSNTWKFQDKIFPIFDDLLAPTSGDQQHYNNMATSETASADSNGNTIFYKLTWTNETIGHRGDCPVEVIKENILHALSMVQYIPPPSGRQEDITKNESVRFYERLRAYFEPSIDLIHLRFEPMSACVEALELHDVGNSDIADIVDRAEDLDSAATETPLANILAKSLETGQSNSAPKSKTMSPINSDEYWAIVVLIILVVAIFFVVMMLIMGLNTYRINQEKRFELQMKLAQARQNSMYLSSMVLADQLQPNNLIQNNHQLNGGGHQQMRQTFADELNSRKSAILEDEKQMLQANGTAPPFLKPTSVQLTGQSAKTMPIESNMNFTMDSINSMQARTMLAGVGQNVFTDHQQQHQRGSMTLNRRTNSRQQILRQTSMASQLSHSQSIITVASMAPAQGAIFVQSTPANVPLVYAPMPMFYESNAETPYEL